MKLLEKNKKKIFRREGNKGTGINEIEDDDLYCI